MAITVANWLVEYGDRVTHLLSLCTPENDMITQTIGNISASYNAWWDAAIPALQGKGLTLEEAASIVDVKDDEIETFSAVSDIVALHPTPGHISPEAAKFLNRVFTAHRRFCAAVA